MLSLLHHISPFRGSQRGLTAGYVCSESGVCEGGRLPFRDSQRGLTAEYVCSESGVCHGARF